MTQEEFAEIALNNPEWGSEHLDLLQSLLEGERIDPMELQDLVEDFLYYTPKVPPKPRLYAEEPPDLASMDKEEIAELQAMPITNVPIPPAPLQVPNVVDLDEWLKKK